MTRSRFTSLLPFLLIGLLPPRPVPAEPLVLHVATFPPFDINCSHNQTRWPPLAALKLDQPPWSTRFPEMLPFREALRTGGPVPPQCRTRLTHNVVWQGAKEWTGFHQAEDKNAWVIENNLVGTDPFFRDAAAGDYRLKPESPAFALGFHQLPVEKMGLTENDERASWPVADEVRADVCHNLTYVAPPPPPRPPRQPRRAICRQVRGTGPLDVRVAYPLCLPGHRAEKGRRAGLQSHRAQSSRQPLGHVGRHGWQLMARGPRRAA